MITLEISGMSYSKKIAYSINKIPITQNEIKQTGPKENTQNKHYNQIAKSRIQYTDLVQNKQTNHTHSSQS
jgi:hypothetical protein